MVKNHFRKFGQLYAEQPKFRCSTQQASSLTAIWSALACGRTRFSSTFS